MEAVRRWGLPRVPDRCPDAGVGTLWIFAIAVMVSAGGGPQGYAASEARKDSSTGWEREGRRPAGGMGASERACIFRGW